MFLYRCLLVHVYNHKFNILLINGVLITCKCTTLNKKLHCDTNMSHPTLQPPNRMDIKRFHITS